MGYNWYDWFTPKPYTDFLKKEVLEKGFESLVNSFGVNTPRQQNEFNAEQAVIANNRTRENMEFQKQLNLDLSRESYSAMVDGMERAGLNSALAYSHSPSVGSVSLGTSHSAQASGEGFNVLKLLMPLLSGSLGIAKAAISSNSAKSLASMTTYKDTFKTGKGYRTVTWKE